LLVSGAGAVTLTVNANGGADYMRIQDAINNSNNGDTILVYSGTYYETVDVSKQLILRGVDTGGGKPGVDASRRGSPTGAITLSAGNTVLEGFIVTGSAYYELYYSAGIWVNSHNNQIRNNDVSNNPYGITLYHYSSNNTLSGNNLSNNGFGIFLYVSSNNMLRGNTVLNNNRTGIYLYYSSNNMLSGNNASKNNYTGIYLYCSSNNTLSGNIVTNNLKGIYLESSWISPNNNNILIGNTALNNSQGIYLDFSSNNTIYNNFFNNTNNSVIISSINKWNITKTPIINFIGGPYLGGNIYASPDGKGFSQTCLDSDHDGTCDLPYTLDDNNIDYLPLAYKATTAGPPALTPTLTSPKPTQIVTPTQKTQPTPASAKTPEEKKDVSGFGAVFAIAGLLAVAYLLRRKG
jgi:nitrous oxidase accessory protein